MNQLRSMFGAPALTALAILTARPDDPKHSQAPVPIPLPGVTAPGEDPHAEMRRLFGKIERDMRELAQQEPTAGSSCPSVGSLCKSSGSGGKPSSDAKNQGGSQKGQSEDGNEPGKSPLDRQGENTTQREATPQSPDKGSDKNGADGGRDPQTGLPKRASAKPIGHDASR